MPDPIVVILNPQPSFRIAPLQSSSTQLVVTSTSLFPADQPRSEFALYLRVTPVALPTQVLTQQPANPLVDNVFTIELAEDGIYEVKLLAFPAVDVPNRFTPATGTVVYDRQLGSLVQLQEVGTTRVYNPVDIELLPASALPFLSASQNYLHLQPGKDRSAQLLGLLLDMQMSGKRALHKQKIRDIALEIQDIDLAIRGIQNEFSRQRYVEAQRLLDLLAKLRSDSCCN